MATNKRIFANRLHRLADYLELKVKPAVEAGNVRWNMQKWAEDAVPRKELTCGTAACAAGYGTVIFAKEGFYLNVGKDINGDPSYNVRFKDAWHFGACIQFFGTCTPFDPYSNCYFGSSSTPSIDKVISVLRATAMEMQKQTF